MAGLTGKSIASAYKSILRVDDDTNGIDANLGLYEGQQLGELVSTDSFDPSSFGNIELPPSYRPQASKIHTGFDEWGNKTYTNLDDLFPQNNQQNDLSGLYTFNLPDAIEDVAQN